MRSQNPGVGSGMLKTRKAAYASSTAASSAKRYGAMRTRPQVRLTRALSADQALGLDKIGSALHKGCLRHRFEVHVCEGIHLVAAPEPVGAVPRDHVTAADQRDFLAELLRLFEIVGRQEDRRPLAVQPADVAPELDPQLEVD